MLQELRIQRLGVIDDALLELHPGLNVVTGETGAGKTMVVTGLGLLLGARADTALVRTGAETAVVEGVVSVDADHPAAARASEAGADIDGGLVLVRTVSAGGRSRAHVGGRTAPVGVLSEIGERLVAVHGQADQWRLRQGDQHRTLLDQFGGASLGAILADYQRLYDAHATVSAELADLRTQARDRAREIDVLQHGLDQLETLDPQPGEDADLRVEDERLSHAEGLRTAAEAAHAHLAGSEEYAAEPAPSTVEAIAAARHALGGEVDHDPRLRELDRRLADLGYLAADLASDLSAYASDVDIDPARLGWVQQRRADLATLTRKYGNTVDDALKWASAAAARLDRLMGSDTRIEALAEEVRQLRTDLARTGGQLSAARQAAALRLAEEVTAELAHLAMGQAVVTVAVSQRSIDPAGSLAGDAPTGAAPDDVDDLQSAAPAAPAGLDVLGLGTGLRYGRHGVDDIEIRLAANPGSPARSVAKAASGGELSRVMLALEVVSGRAGAVEVPTFVFDEVDAGVGGAAALAVGARLAVLASRAQVVVVTHLPQVAAYADRHLVVRKASDGHITASGVHALEGDERLRELARMMAGVDSDTALDHARELVAEATSRRTPTASR